jgi:hypothetical protein
MKHSDRIRRLGLATIVLSLGVLLAPASARADASCSSLLSGAFNNLQQNGGFNYFEITVTRDPPYNVTQDVTFGAGTLGVSAPFLYGTANVEYSQDWAPTNNPFDVSLAQSIRVWLTTNGTLWIWNDNLAFWIVDGFDMSCMGGLASKYVPGAGLVTVAIRGWVPNVI